MKTFRSKSENPELNITALIDIIFILLIFFMVSSSFLKPTISVKLPVAASKDKIEQKKLSVYISENLEIYLEKEILPINEIQDLLAEEILTTPDLTIMLYSDKNVMFEHVVKVLDALKLSGVKNVAISHNTI